MRPLSRALLSTSLVLGVPVCALAQPQPINAPVADPVAPGVAAPAPVQAEATEADFRAVVDRSRELLLRGELPKPETIQGFVAGLDENGRWPEINYNDPTPASWSTSGHLNRVRLMARAVVDPKSALFNDAKTQDALLRALDDWILHRYKNPNWWHNDIGVPQIMADIILLLGDRLSGARRDGALEVLNQGKKAKPNDGANTMWMANIELLYGALTRSAALVDKNSRLISGEIHVTTGEGIQSDGSYHQHHERLQQFHYGGAFINDTARLGWVLHGTPWAIPTDKLQIVADCVLNGSQWMVRGTATVPGTLDRSVSRPGTLSGGDLRGTARFLREALPASAPALDALIARQDGTGAPLVGFRAYPRSDFAVYQRPGFGFFLKTISDRTLWTEFINGENQKGQLLNCGDHYVVRDGKEYADMPPVWDWDAVPGVTWAPGAGKIVRQPFVGAVSDGESGASVMDLRFATKEGAALGARKLWASHGDVTVCLIANLSATGVAAPVHTALDQCLLRGPVTICDQNGKLQIIGLNADLKPPVTGAVPAMLNALTSQPVRWIHHSGFAYSPLGNTPVSLKMGFVQGAWLQINKSGSKIPVVVPVFLPTLEHGASPQGATSGFVVAAAPTPQDAEKLFAHPTWTVTNTDNLQAVAFNDGTVMGAFYGAADPLTVPDPMALAPQSPCLFLQTRDAVYLCDPTHKGGPLTLSIGGKATTVTLPPDGLTLKLQR